MAILHGIWSWRRLPMRVVQEIGDDNISIIAAGVAFYSLLTIFPSFAMVMSLYGLFFNPSDVERQLLQMEGLLPDAAMSILGGALHQLASKPSPNLSLNFAASFVFALWSARTGAATLVTALNIAYDTPETRSFLVRQALALSMTSGGILFVFASLILIALLPAAIDFLPVDQAVRRVLGFVRWPILLVLVATGLGIVYRLTPNERVKDPWGIAWGAAAATVLWLLLSAGFSFYVSHFGSYDKTYGSLGAVVVLLMWFYLSAFIVLVGAEIDAEVTRERAARRSDPPPQPSPTRGEGA